MSLSDVTPATIATISANLKTMMTSTALGSLGLGNAANLQNVAAIIGLSPTLQQQVSNYAAAVKNGTAAPLDLANTTSDPRSSGFEELREELRGQSHFSRTNSLTD